MDDLTFDTSLPVVSWWCETAEEHAGGRSPDPVAAAPGATSGVRVGAVAQELAASVSAAHSAALRAHRALQEWVLAGADTAPRPPTARGRALSAESSGTPPPLPRPPRVPRQSDPVVQPGAVPPTAETAAVREGASLRAVRATLTWHRASTAPSFDGLAVTALPPQQGSDPRRWEVRHQGLVVGEATSHGNAIAPASPASPGSQPPPRTGQFKPLARAVRDRLHRSDLDRLTTGDLVGVLGEPFAHPHASALPASAFTRLDDVVVTGSGTGRHLLGQVRATTTLGDTDGPDWTTLLAAAWQALHVHALHQGMHLCLPHPSATPWTEEPVQVEVCDAERLVGPLRLVADVTAIGLVPRPHVLADVSFSDDRATLAHLHAVGCVLRERPGSPLGPGESNPRRTADGEQVFAHELHMAHAADGDLRVTHGARHRSVHPVRPRLPRGDLLMLDRMVDSPAAHGSYPVGSSYVTEYDVPASPWYVEENAGTTPHLAHLESSLQAAAFVGAALGVALEFPDQDLTVRNLDGCSRLLRAVDLRGRTVRQRTTLLAHTPLPGAVLQRYGYELAVAGETFYTGEAVHGFFTQPVLAQQQGLDGGRLMPPWLRQQTPQPDARPLGPDADHPAASGRLAFLDSATTTFVEDGGRYGLGYLLCDRPIDPDDWFFGHHFLHDPVMPGSCGVEMLLQMTRACLRAAKITTAAMPEPQLGAELRWTYRGQIQPHHRMLQAEVHLRDVTRTDTGVTVTAEGSVWRDGLRIYAVDNIAVHLPGGSPAREAA